MTRLPSTRAQRGVTLVELMISLLLGLLVVAGAVGIFTSNRRAYASTETLGRLQETGRVAFELMSRDVREAGATPCGKGMSIANTLNNNASNWYTDFSVGLRGYNSGAASGSSSGTDAIDLLSAVSGDTYLTDYNAASAVIGVSDNSGFTPGDIVMICDYKQGAIFQVTHLASSKLGHNQGNSVQPGNCTKDLNFPVNCAANNTKSKAFKEGAVVAHLQATRWYVGDTTKGRALFRSSLRTNGGNAAAVNEQVTEGVEDMQLTYLEQGEAAYTDSAGVADWGNVVAVRITLTLEAREGTESGKNIQGVDGNELTREITHTVTLRNRLS